MNVCGFIEGEFSRASSIARMAQPFAPLRSIPCLGALVAAALLTACGDAQDTPSVLVREPGPPGAPTPAAAEPATLAVGTVELLGRLYRSVALGPALSTQAFSLDVVHLREQLWPDLALEGAEPAALTHVRASHVAGAVAAQLASDPGARDGLAKDDPFGLALHDAWVAVAAGGPERYRAWCAGEAQALFTQREQELQKLFERSIR